MSDKTTKMNARVWPVGTMVVTLREVEPGDGGRARPKGACGVIVKSPEDPNGIYRIGFPDGGEFNVAAKSLDILKHYQQGELANVEAVAQSHKLYDRIHYKCVVGSRAYGLDHEDSDTDLRGFYLAPANLHWSLFGTPEQLQRPDSDECYWELEKFLKLALKANPNVLECMYTPLVRVQTEIASELLEMREIFLSRLIYQTYNRYVMSQFKSMSKKREKGEEPNTKHAMHLVRLMLSGIKILEEGFVPVRVDEVLEKRLLEIKHGERDFGEVDAWRIELHETFDEAFAASDLPDRPDYMAANDFLLRARRWAAENDPV